MADITVTTRAFWTKNQLLYANDIQRLLLFQHPYIYTTRIELYGS
ncbi:hypothetical protein Hanom_Chr17g01550011 [Helianthus anomalus]